MPAETPAAAVSAVGLSLPMVAVYDCWNKIGVNGDGTCRELEKFIHCRNCPVYSAAGTRLLDREIPASYRREWTELFSRKKTVAAPGKVAIVIFRIDTEWLALPIPVFQEVVERRTIHSLPHRRQGIVLGLTNIRGELLICVSVGRLLGLERAAKKEKPRTIYDRLLVVQWNNSRLVFPVDEVHGVHRYHPDELKEVPATLARNAANYSRGILSWSRVYWPCPSSHSAHSDPALGEAGGGGGGTGRDISVGCLDEELLMHTLNRSLT